MLLWSQSRFFGGASLASYFLEDFLPLQRQFSQLGRNSELLRLSLSRVNIVNRFKPFTAILDHFRHLFTLTSFDFLRGPGPKGQSSASPCRHLVLRRQRQCLPIKLDHLGQSSAPPRLRRSEIRVPAAFTSRTTSST